MTTFKFTETHDVDSTAVETLTYNANTKDLAVDLHDEVYVYPGVSKKRFKQLLNADSVGRDYRDLKETHGPAQKLGNYRNITFIPEAKDVSKASKAKPHEPTPTFPTLPLPTLPKPPVVFDPTEGTDPVPSNPTFAGTEAVEKFSLTPSPVAPAADATYTVDFVNGAGQHQDHHAKGATSVEEAVAAVQEFAEALGVEVTVTGVYVDFE